MTAEVQEGLTAYEWRVDPDIPYCDRLPGPGVLLGLRQDGVTTSADFDWALLHRMFAEHVIDETGHPRDDRAWHTTAARPTDPVDRQNWHASVQAGAPRWLGKGWDMKVAQSTQSCLFGAHFGISPSSILGEIDAELQRHSIPGHNLVSRSVDKAFSEAERAVLTTSSGEAAPVRGRSSSSSGTSPASATTS